MEPVDHLTGRRLYDGRVVKLDLETVRAPDGSILELEMIRHPGAAAVVPLVDGTKPRLLLLRQYRYAAGGVLWEIPAGVLEPGETPLQCARRELLEEAGARARELEHLTTVFTTPGFTDEVIHLFLARDVVADQKPGPASDEFLEVQEVELDRVMEMIEEGEIQDAKSVVAILYTVRFRLDGRI